MVLKGAASPSPVLSFESVVVFESESDLLEDSVAGAALVGDAVFTGVAVFVGVVVVLAAAVAGRVTTFLGDAGG